MKLTILGSGTGIVTARRGPAGYLVNVNNKSLLLDSGPGTLKKLADAGTGFDKVDYAIYTHFHPDHVADLISLLFALRIPGHSKREYLTILGPTGMKDLYHNLLNVFDNYLEPRGYDLTIKELFESHIDFEDFRISSSHVKHLDNSIAYRIVSEGKSLVYSGDTDYCESLINLAKDVDLLLIECSYPKHIKHEGHLNATLAGRIARESNCKKLVLTHFYPICDEHDIVGQCKEEFDGEIVAAEDLMVIEI